jgi:hypothetical protein
MSYARFFSVGDPSLLPSIILTISDREPNKRFYDITSLDEPGISEVLPATRYTIARQELLANRQFKRQIGTLLPHVVRWDFARHERERTPQEVIEVEKPLDDARLV